MKKAIILIFMVFYLIGCEILSPPIDGKIEISGKIINESTGEVVDNLSLILVKSIGRGALMGTGGDYKTVAQTSTDSDGNFYLFYDAEDNQNSLAFYINKEPHNNLYSIKLLNITPGTQLINKTYSVYQNTTLKVTLNSQPHLKPRTYTLWLPGIGTSIDTAVMSTRAKGNFYNSVRLNYSVDDKHYEITDSVFCPIDTVTNFVLSL